MYSYHHHRTNMHPCIWETSWIYRLNLSYDLDYHSYHHYHYRTTLTINIIIAITIIIAIVIIIIISNIITISIITITIIFIITTTFIITIITRIIIFISATTKLSSLSYNIHCYNRRYWKTAVAEYQNTRKSQHSEWTNTHVNISVKIVYSILYYDAAGAFQELGAHEYTHTHHHVHHQTDLPSVSSPVDISLLAC